MDLKKIVAWLFAATAVFLLSGCLGSSTPNGSQTGSITFGYKDLPSDISRVTAMAVKGSQVLNDDLKVTTADRSAEGTLYNVEPGIWSVLVEVRDSYNQVIRRGKGNVEVKPGVARLALIALSTVDGESDIITSNPLPPGTPRKGPRTRLVVVSIGDYPGQALDLDGPRVDASNMSQVLIDGNLLDVQPIFIRDSAATKANIKNTVDSLKSISADENIIFYYSGHGFADNVHESIVPYDAIGYKPDNSVITDPEKFITEDELEQWFAGIQSRKVVFIFDSCNSGGMTKNLSLGRASLKLINPVRLARDLSVGGYTVLMASDKEEPSWDTSFGGVYTSTLMQGLVSHSADFSKDGVITPEELHNYAAAKVPQKEPSQHPQFFRGNASDIPVFIY